MDTERGDLERVDLQVQDSGEVLVQVGRPAPLEEATARDRPIGDREPGARGRQEADVVLGAALGPVPAPAAEALHHERGRPDLERYVERHFATDVEAALRGLDGDVQPDAVQLQADGAVLPPLLVDVEGDGKPGAEVELEPLAFDVRDVEVEVEPDTVAEQLVGDAERAPPTIG